MNDKNPTRILALEFATNLTGALGPKIIKRVEKYLQHPTFDNWEDIHCIIIDGKGTVKTIWNAVIDLDPFFPRYGRTTNRSGDVVREWDRIPGPETVLAAIRHAVYKPIVNRLN